MDSPSIINSVRRGVAQVVLIEPLQPEQAGVAGAARIPGRPRVVAGDREAVIDAERRATGDDMRLIRTCCWPSTGAFASFSIATKARTYSGR